VEGRGFEPLTYRLPGNESRTQNTSEKPTNCGILSLSPAIRKPLRTVAKTREIRRYSDGIDGTKPVQDFEPSTFICASFAHLDDTDHQADHAGMRPVEPSPAQIAERARAIRESWSEREHRRRAGLPDDAGWRVPRVRTGDAVSEPAA